MWISASTTRAQQGGSEGVIALYFHPPIYIRRETLLHSLRVVYPPLALERLSLGLRDPRKAFDWRLFDLPCGTQP